MLFFEENEITLELSKEVDPKKIIITFAGLG